MTASTEQRAPAPPDRRRLPRPGSLEVLTAVLVLLVLLRGQVAGLVDHPAVQTWSTVFVSVTVQALPFLVSGVLLSAVLTAYVPPQALARALPRRPALAVPVAGGAGMLLPGCECASVPVAGSLVRRGVAPAAALTFLLAAPAVNPIVLVSTAVAFPGQPEVVLARFLASFATAVALGWAWLRLGRTDLLRLRSPHLPEGSPRGAVFRAAMQHDVLHAGGFLVVGGAVAATFGVALPTSVVDALAEQPVLAVLALALLAVAVAICSEADAFVAASFSSVSPTAQLAFMVVGPAVDVKLIAMQSGTFGGAFAARFAPATFGVAVLSSALVGWWLL
nr:permease [Vallicoccus soli]